MNRISHAATAVIVVCLALTSFVSENAAKPAETERPKWLPAPFKLTPDEKASVTKVLEEWERQSEKFANYSCDFDCLTYNDARQRQGVGKGRFCIDKDGRISYSVEGDRGLAMLETAKKVQWIYDGQQWISAYSEDKEVTRVTVPQDKKLNVRTPFVLRANAKELAAQYHIRITKHDQAQHQIYVQFYPRAEPEFSVLGRWRRGQGAFRDWRDFDHVDLILSDETYVVQAMQLHDSAYSRTTYIARNPVVNAADTADWFEFETPIGWTELKYPLDVQAEKKTPD
jgi:hypothetical protein